MTDKGHDAARPSRSGRRILYTFRADHPLGKVVAARHEMSMRMIFPGRTNAMISMPMDPLRR